MKKLSPKIIFRIQEFHCQGLSTRAIQKAIFEQGHKVSLGVYLLSSDNSLRSL